MEWDYIDNITSLEGVNILHCDTRDFHCLLKQDWIDTKDGRNRKVSRRFWNFGYQIREDKLLPWLKSIEQMTGGKGEWRCPVFENVECDGWLKYIRCYRNPKNPDYFVVCNRDGIPILWELCTEKNLKKELLNFMED